MSLEFMLRLVGMVVLAAVGWAVGSQLAGATVSDANVSRGIVLLALAGAALGLLITPYLTTRPYGAIRRRLRQIPANQLIAGSIGMTLGALVALILTPPLAQLPGLLGEIAPFVVALIFGYLGLQILILRERDIVSLLRARLGRDRATKRYILLDTSVIIDGRITDIAKTGFLDGVLLVPNFVLSELQHIAGSKDALRRNRGKRGLDILNQLQKDNHTPVEISDIDVPTISEVDTKLVAIARDLNAAVLTTDYNLNKVAELQGVRVLNINELANAVKTILLPGEALEIEIIQPGREQGQGVGYLDDGTMVVVEQGAAAIGERRSVEVTRILQTVAGRMIFAHLANGYENRR